MKKLLLLALVAVVIGTSAAAISIWLTYAGVEETFVDFVVEGGRDAL